MAQSDVRYQVRPASLPPTTARLVTVEASAGTGKTFFLEHRVVDLILAGAPLREILLVTFTEKATAELRRRIRRIIDSLLRGGQTEPPDAPHWVLDHTARTRLRQARAEFGQAGIFTIHGFCQRVLAEEAFAAGRWFEQQRVADEVAFDVAFYRVLRRTLAHREPHRALLQAFLAETRGDAVAELRGLLLACARRNDAALPEVPVAATAREALAVLLQARPLLDTFLRAAPKLHLSTRKKIATICDGLRDLSTQFPNDEVALWRVLTRKRDDIAYLRTHAAKVMPADAALRISVEQLVNVGTLNSVVAAQWTPLVLAEMEVTKQANAQFDFQDLLAHVWSALGSARGAAFAAELRKRYPWALIDEFQDTDALQWNIFRAVWMHADAQCLTIVGDPKQSIYGFRGADVATYLAARAEMLAAGAHEVVLADNFRSTPQVVDGINLLLGAGDLTPYFDGEVRYDHPSRAAGHIQAVCAEPGVVVFEPLTRTSAKVTASAITRAWATRLAAEVAMLLAEPLQWDERGVRHTLSARDILVVTRKSKEASEIAAALREHGIASSRVQQERLFDQPQAFALLDLFEALAQPRDRSVRMRALRTPFFAVPWEQVFAVANAPDHHPSLVLLQKWQELAAARRFDALFAHIMHESGFVERALVLGDGERAIVNTQHVLDLLAEQTAMRRWEFHELLALLRSWVRGNGQDRPDDSDVQRVETDGDAVQIMTIHRAKGLEAPVVFFYGGDDKPPNSRVQQYREGGERRISIDANERIADVISDQAREENRRLGYVAITRAKVRLYLTMYQLVALPEMAAYSPLNTRVCALAHGRHLPVVQQLVRFEEFSIDEAGNRAPASMVSTRARTADDVGAVAVRADSQGDDTAESPSHGGDGKDSSEGEVVGPSWAAVTAVLRQWRAPVVPAETPWPLADLPPHRAAIEMWSYTGLARRALAATNARAAATEVVAGGRASGRLSERDTMRSFASTDLRAHVPSTQMVLALSDANAVVKEYDDVDDVDAIVDASGELTEARADQPALGASRESRAPQGGRGVERTSGNASLPPGAASGLFLHALIERTPHTIIAAAPALPAFVGDPAMQTLARQCASAQGLVPGAVVSRGLVVVHRLFFQPFVDDTLHAWPPLAQAAALEREVEFLYPGAAAGHGFIAGAMDALVQWPRGDSALAGADVWADAGAGVLAGAGALAGDATPVASEPAPIVLAHAPHAGQVWLVDYKSDLLAGVPELTAEGGYAPDVLAALARARTSALVTNAGEPPLPWLRARERVAAKYQLQADLYLAAARRMFRSADGDVNAAAADTAAPLVGGMLFVFLRHGVTVKVVRTSAHIAAALASHEVIV